jgi:dihydroorotase
VTRKPDILISGGILVDPSGAEQRRQADLLISDGRIRASGSAAGPPARLLEAAGLLVVPGLIDMHVHLREPGGEHKETIATGTAAALAGGFTAVACMPNTTPALDSVQLLRRIQQTVHAQARSRVYPVACLSKGRRGRELVDFAALRAAGAVAFSDDGDGLDDESLMDAAFASLARLDAPAIQHCESSKFPRGVMHEGRVSRELGLPGSSPRAEEDMIERDLALAERHNARYHVAHISTDRAIGLVRAAKARGVRVTTEVCPHHLLLTHEACRSLDSNYKMHPPLREQADVEACIAGVVDGTIDILVTDHAPHAPQEKARGFLEAPAGVIGLETALALFVKALVEPGHISWPRLIEMMSTAPARIFGLPGGTLQEESPADVTIIDPDAAWTIDVERFVSKSHNCPFQATAVRGRVVATIVGGVLQYGGGGARLHA